MASTNASRAPAPALSGWEIAIRAALGKLDNVPEDLKAFIGEQIWENAFTVLPIRLDPVLDVHTLPRHHRETPSTVCL
jgi:PIN domain nuclease of toxin-antitoxin system